MNHNLTKNIQLNAELDGDGGLLCGGGGDLGELLCLGMKGCNQNAKRLGSSNTAVVADLDLHINYATTSSLKAGTPMNGNIVVTLYGLKSPSPKSEPAVAASTTNASTSDEDIIKYLVSSFNITIEGYENTLVVRHRYKRGPVFFNSKYRFYNQTYSMMEHMHTNRPTVSTYTAGDDGKTCSSKKFIFPFSILLSNELKGSMPKHTNKAYAPAEIGGHCGISYKVTAQITIKQPNQSTSLFTGGNTSSVNPSTIPNVDSFTTKTFTSNIIPISVMSSSPASRGESQNGMVMDVSVGKKRSVPITILCGLHTYYEDQYSLDYYCGAHPKQQHLFIFPGHDMKIKINNNNTNQEGNAADTDGIDFMRSAYKTIFKLTQKITWSAQGRVDVDEIHWKYSLENVMEGTISIPLRNLVDQTTGRHIGPLRNTYIGGSLIHVTHWAILYTVDKNSRTIASSSYPIPVTVTSKA